MWKLIAILRNKFMLSLTFAILTAALTVQAQSTVGTVNQNIIVQYYFLKYKLRSYFNFYKIGQ